MPWSDAPAITVVLVVALLALVVVPLAQMLGDGAGAQHGLEPLLELVAVLLGLLVVSVSLHALEAQEQARANVLVAGFGVAAACNFLHGVLVHSGPVHMPPGSADMSLWLSSWARVAEALTLGLTATRLSSGEYLTSSTAAPLDTIVLNIGRKVVSSNTANSPFFPPTAM